MASLTVEVDDSGEIVTEYLGVRVTGTCVLSRLAFSRDGPHPQVLLLTQAQVVMSRVKNIEEFRMLKLI